MYVYVLLSKQVGDLRMHQVSGVLKCLPHFKGPTCMYWSITNQIYTCPHCVCSTLQRELETLSKKIATLLSRPLCDVVLTLREMKAVQEQKVSEY